MGEHCVRIAGVGGSNPPISTIGNNFRTFIPPCNEGEWRVQVRLNDLPILDMEPLEYRLAEQTPLIKGALLEQEIELCRQLKSDLEIGLYQVLALPYGFHGSP